MSCVCVFTGHFSRCPLALFSQVSIWVNPKFASVFVLCDLVEAFDNCMIVKSNGCVGDCGGGASTSFSDEQLHSMSSLRIGFRAHVNLVLRLRGHLCPELRLGSLSNSGARPHVVKHLGAFFSSKSVKKGSFVTVCVT